MYDSVETRCRVAVPLPILVLSQFAISDSLRGEISMGDQFAAGASAAIMKTIKAIDTILAGENLKISGKRERR